MTSISMEGFFFLFFILTFISHSNTRHIFCCYNGQLTEGKLWTVSMGAIWSRQVKDIWDRSKNNQSWARCSRGAQTVTAHHLPAWSSQFGWHSTWHATSNLWWLWSRPNGELMPEEWSSWWPLRMPGTSLVSLERRNQHPRCHTGKGIQAIKYIDTCFCVPFNSQPISGSVILSWVSGEHNDNSKRNQRQLQAPYTTTARSHYHASF